MVAEVRELSGGGAHVSLDALGHLDTCFNSVACLRKRGRHVQVGLMTADYNHPAVPMDKVIGHELEIVGSHGMQAREYGRMFQTIASGDLEPAKLVTRTATLEEGARILTEMGNYDVLGVAVIDRF